ncbi:MAG: PTS IIA-like nitrogen regulatory protein PtsN [Alphaproteobacteria bacterium]|nr:PTS IIA-like nitrogen regulatory protein PtsN [Alphaproteobacteria bacterium]
MDMADLLIQDGVVANLKAGSKKQALQELSQQAAALTGLHERVIFDALLQREKLGTTGIGRGIAIPHGKMQDLERLHGIFARLPKPIDFDAIDEQPVDLIFLLLAPETAGADHLKALARISRLLRDDTICAKLRGADNPEALFALLTLPTVSPAA